MSSEIEKVVTEEDVIDSLFSADAQVVNGKTKKPKFDKVTGSAILEEGTYLNLKGDAVFYALGNANVTGYYWNENLAANPAVAKTVAAGTVNNWGKAATSLTFARKAVTKKVYASGADVTMFDTTAGDIFAGSYNKFDKKNEEAALSKTEADVEITILNATVKNVYAGGEGDDVFKGDVTVNVSNSKVGKIYAGGKAGAYTVGDLTVNITNDGNQQANGTGYTFSGAIYGTPADKKSQSIGYTYVNVADYTGAFKASLNYVEEVTVTGDSSVVFSGNMKEVNTLSVEGAATAEVKKGTIYAYELVLNADTLGNNKAAMLTLGKKLNPEKVTIVVADDYANNGAVNLIDWAGYTPSKKNVVIEPTFAVKNENGGIVADYMYEYSYDANNKLVFTYTGKAFILHGVKVEENEFDAFGNQITTEAWVSFGKTFGAADDVVVIGDNYNYDNKIIDLGAGSNKIDLATGGDGAGAFELNVTKASTNLVDAGAFANGVEIIDLAGKGSNTVVAGDVTGNVDFKKSADATLIVDGDFDGDVDFSSVVGDATVVLENEAIINAGAIDAGEKVVNVNVDAYAEAEMTGLNFENYLAGAAKGTYADYVLNLGKNAVLSNGAADLVDEYNRNMTVDANSELYVMGEMSGNALVADGADFTVKNYGKVTGEINAPSVYGMGGNDIARGEATVQFQNHGKFAGKINMGAQNGNDAFANATIEGAIATDAVVTEDAEINFGGGNDNLNFFGNNEFAGKVTKLAGSNLTLNFDKGVTDFTGSISYTQEMDLENAGVSEGRYAADEDNTIAGYDATFVNLDNAVLNNSTKIIANTFDVDNAKVTGDIDFKNLNVNTGSLTFTEDKVFEGYDADGATINVAGGAALFAEKLTATNINVGDATGAYIESKDLTANGGSIAVFGSANIDGIATANGGDVTFDRATADDFVKVTGDVIATEDADGFGGTVRANAASVKLGNVKADNNARINSGDMTVGTVDAADIAVRGNGNVGALTAADGDAIVATYNDVEADTLTVDGKVEATAGDVKLNAKDAVDAIYAGDVKANAVYDAVNDVVDGGDVTLTGAGYVEAGNITAVEAANADRTTVGGGDVAIRADKATVGFVKADGNVTINSADAAVNGTIEADAVTIRGNVTVTDDITAKDNVIVATKNNAEKEIIAVENITAAGNVRLNAKEADDVIVAGNITANAWMDEDENVFGGNVTLAGAGSVTAGDIDANGVFDEDGNRLGGGNVNLNAVKVEVGTITADGNVSFGGAVEDITFNGFVSADAMNVKEDQTVTFNAGAAINDIVIEDGGEDPAIINVANAAVNAETLTLEDGAELELNLNGTTFTVADPEVDEFGNLTEYSATLDSNSKITIADGAFVGGIAEADGAYDATVALKNATVDKVKFNGSAIEVENAGTIGELEFANTLDISGVVSEEDDVEDVLTVTNGIVNANGILNVANININNVIDLNQYDKYGDVASTGIVNTTGTVTLTEVNAAVSGATSTYEDEDGNVQDVLDDKLTIGTVTGNLNADGVEFVDVETAEKDVTINNAQSVTIDTVVGDADISGAEIEAVTEDGYYVDADGDGVADLVDNTVVIGTALGDVTTADVATVEITAAAGSINAVDADLTVGSWDNINYDEDGIEIAPDTISAGSVNITAQAGDIKGTVTATDGDLTITAAEGTVIEGTLTVTEGNLTVTGAKVAGDITMTNINSNVDEDDNPELDKEGNVIGEADALEINVSLVEGYEGTITVNGDAGTTTVVDLNGIVDNVVVSFEGEGKIEYAGNSGLGSYVFWNEKATATEAKTISADGKVTYFGDVVADIEGVDGAYSDFTVGGFLFGGYDSEAVGDEQFTAADAEVKNLTVNGTADGVLSKDSFFSKIDIAETELPAAAEVVEAINAKYANGFVYANVDTYGTFDEDDEYVADGNITVENTLFVGKIDAQGAVKLGAYEAKLADVVAIEPAPGVFEALAGEVVTGGIHEDEVIYIRESGSLIADSINGGTVYYVNSDFIADHDNVRTYATVVNGADVYVEGKEVTITGDFLGNLDAENAVVTMNGNIAAWVATVAGKGDYIHKPEKVGVADIDAKTFTSTAAGKNIYANITAKGYDKVDENGEVVEDEFGNPVPTEDTVIKVVSTVNGSLTAEKGNIEAMDVKGSIYAYTGDITANNVLGDYVDADGDVVINGYADNKPYSDITINGENVTILGQVGGTVTYQKDAEGNIQKDAQGNPIILDITAADITAEENATFGADVYGNVTADKVGKTETATTTKVTGAVTANEIALASVNVGAVVAGEDNGDPEYDVVAGDVTVANVEGDFFYFGMGAVNAGNIGGDFYYDTIEGNNTATVGTIGGNVEIYAAFNKAQTGNVTVNTKGIGSADEAVNAITLNGAKGSFELGEDSEDPFATVDKYTHITLNAYTAADAKADIYTGSLIINGAGYVTINAANITGSVSVLKDSEGNVVSKTFKATVLDAVDCEGLTINSNIRLTSAVTMVNDFVVNGSLLTEQTQTFDPADGKLLATVDNMAKAATITAKNVKITGDAYAESITATADFATIEIGTEGKLATVKVTNGLSADAIKVYGNVTTSAVAANTPIYDKDKQYVAGSSVVEITGSLTGALSAHKATIGGSFEGKVTGYDIPKLTEMVEGKEVVVREAIASSLVIGGGKATFEAASAVSNLKFTAEKVQISGLCNVTANSIVADHSVELYDATYNDSLPTTQISVGGNLTVSGAGSKAQVLMTGANATIDTAGKVNSGIFFAAAGAQTLTVTNSATAIAYLGNDQSNTLILNGTNVILDYVNLAGGSDTLNVQSDATINGAISNVENFVFGEDGMLNVGTWALGATTGISFNAAGANGTMVAEGSITGTALTTDSFITVGSEQWKWNGTNAFANAAGTKSLELGDSDSDSKADLTWNIA